MKEVPKLSLGIDSTLGNWYDLTAAVFGADGVAAKFLQGKIDEQGRDAVVIADERQLLMVLGTMTAQEMDAAMRIDPENKQC